MSVGERSPLDEGSRHRIGEQLAFLCQHETVASFAEQAEIDELSAFGGPRR